MIDKEKFGQALLLLRKQKNMSQKELAAQLNVTPAAVSKWEHGQNYPDITMISSIAEIFEVSCDDLLQPEKILSPSPNNKLTQPVTEPKRYFPSKWIPVLVVLTLLLTVSCLSLYNLFAKANTSPFEIISTRSTETILGESIYEVAVLCQGEPVSEKITEFCMELRKDYEEGTFGSTSFSTMKVLFYTDSEVVSSFEESDAVLITHLYFEG